MSTRAVYSFYDLFDTTQTWQVNGYHVYKHHDGYPEGAAFALAKTLENAWELPRFEADEFAASFVASNKSNSGGVRLANSQTSATDIEYAYEVFQSKNGQLILRAFDVNCWGATPRKTVFFYGRLKDFIIKYGDKKAKETWDKYAPVSEHPAVKVCKDCDEYKEYMRLKAKFDPITLMSNDC